MESEGLSSVLLELLIIVVLMIFKGFFSGSEIAIVNSDKIKMRHLAKQGKKGAALVLKRFRGNRSPGKKLFRQLASFRQVW